MAASVARLIVLDKPALATSFDMVREVRRVTGQRRVGHGGTLDPFATGVLLMGVGRATRLLTFVRGGHKRYRLTVRFGQGTDSHDATGTVTAEGDPRFEPTDLRSVLARFVGELEQRPPAVSALKLEGQRAYRLQRRGLLADDLPPRRVRIDSIELLAYERPCAVLRVTCGGGTYMRALARDLGEALSCPAHAAALVREAVGPFEIAEAVGPGELAAHWPHGRGVMEAAAIARQWPCHQLRPADLVRIRHGQAIEATRETSAEQPVGLLDEGGALAAVAFWTAGKWQPTVVLAEAEHGNP